MFEDFDIYLFLPLLPELLPPLSFFTATSISVDLSGSKTSILSATVLFVKVTIESKGISYSYDPIANL